MPSLSKKSLSLYLRNRCERQFVFSLYRDSERKARGMPEREPGRPGLGLVGAAGYEWQDMKVGELRDVFGEASVLESPRRNERRPEQIPLAEALPRLRPYQFVVEAAYRADTPTFRTAIGLTDLRDFFGAPVSISELHPDIVQCLPPRGPCAGPAVETELDPYALECRPSGDTRKLEDGDQRLRLRVIDVKLTSEPGAHYFAEVVYYSMSLASWLIEEGLDDRFVVVAAPAVWPGSHEASNLYREQEAWRESGHQPTGEEMAAALEKDLELAPVDVFAPRLQRLLSRELPDLLSRDWTDLSWHVDYHCKGCEFLGYPRRDREGNLVRNPAHCQPSAEDQGHLSRVVGLSRGASEQLRRHHVRDLAALAARQPGDDVFEEHQGLQAKRAVFPHRARAIQRNETRIIPKSGGDALMPRWPNLHVYVFLDYDLSSAITAAISLRAFWREPLPYGSTETPHTLEWAAGRDDAETFLITGRSIERERAAVLDFLRTLRGILGEVAAQDTADYPRRKPDTRRSTYQIYLWDEAQRKHLVRLVGRHLPHILADPEIRDLAWLFPPPELLQHPEDATRKSPITLVAGVVENTVALPIPHHFRLLDVVQHFHPAGQTPPSFEYLYLYQEPMSDLLPPERLHEWWQGIGNRELTEDRIAEMSRKKAYALSLVVRRLEDELKDVLARQAAPPIVRPPNGVVGVAPQSLLWYEYARLNAALDGLEIDAIRAMPPHEREARLKSARLIHRLEGEEALAALASMNAALGLDLRLEDDLLVYELSPRSREVNVKPGDFQLALAPEEQHGFLDDKPYKHLRGTPLSGVAWASSFAESGLTSVTVEAIDRDHGLIALRGNYNCRIRDLERYTSLDFSQNVVLDPTYADFLTKRIRQTVLDIGDPGNAQPDARTLEALGLPADRQPGTSPVTPAAEVLWDPGRVHAELTNADLGPARQALAAYFERTDSPLDASQWRAWEEALSRRLCLLWGPPGTGKSRTLRAVILGAILTARAEGRPLRLVVTAHTYTAIDNVLLSLDDELRDLLPDRPYSIYRLQSEWHVAPDAIGVEHADVVQVAVNRREPSDELRQLVGQLEDPHGIVVLGSPQQQLHNLALASKACGAKHPKETIRPWFDLVILDEASQMDVASSTLVFSKLAPGGACVLAGDDLQLPPIQSAEPPMELEHVVGSVYNYFRRHHKIPPSSLDVNYRSNRTIVEFTRMAGYSPDLRSHSPDLQLDLLSPVPSERPADWPADLYWSPDWAAFLDPEHPAVAYVYEDSLSSQANAFEADAVACLLWLLRGRLADRLLGERDARGRVQPPSTTSCSPVDFWARAVGVVTPHKVQMAKIVARLQKTFPADSTEAIRRAVDTVERFQGQQRDVVVASFGLGDPDVIRTEDEFLYNLNRFNVLTSRARAKVIVLVTRPLLEHLSDDPRVLKDSRLLKLYAETYCRDPRRVEVGWIRDGMLEAKVGVLRVR